MKKIILTISLAIIAISVFVSCSNNDSYASQLAAEKTVLSAYIKRNNINVLKTFPTTKWNENDYVLTSSGMYFHLVDSGDVDPNYILEEGSIVTPRYYEYTLTLPKDTTLYNWSVLDYPYPAYYAYSSTSTSPCAAFQEAFGYMKYNNSIALLLVPSKIGRYTSDLTSATPYGYTLRITFQK